MRRRGAIRLDSIGATAVTVDRVSVDDHSSITGGEVFDKLWGSFTLPAGASVIQTGNDRPTTRPMS